MVADAINRPVIAINVKRRQILDIDSSNGLADGLCLLQRFMLSHLSAWRCKFVTPNHTPKVLNANTLQVVLKTL